MQHSPRFKQLCDQAREQIQEVDVHQMNSMLSNDDNVVLIDVRETHEWSKDHLPKAIHLSKGLIECYIEKTVPDVNQKIVLYCGGGYRSALAALNLQQMGYQQVYSMAGGYRGWCEAQYELDTVI